MDLYTALCSRAELCAPITLPYPRPTPREHAQPLGWSARLALHPCTVESACFAPPPHALPLPNPHPKQIGHALPLCPRSRGWEASRTIASPANTSTFHDAALSARVGPTLINTTSPPRFLVASTSLNDEYTVTELPITSNKSAEPAS